MKKSVYDSIRFPVLTEKAITIRSDSKVIFKVSSDVNKTSMKSIIERIYGIEPDSVNVINVKGRSRIFKGIKGSTKDYKKVIVTFPKDTNIDSIVGV